MQTTVAGNIQFSGTGLHTGQPVCMEIRPAEAGHGIRFLRIDLPGGAAEIPARHGFVSSTRYRTELASREGVSVSTVEHLMAAFAVLEIDNAVVALDGPEIPAMDGSALPFARGILEAGIARLGGRRQAIRILGRVEVEANGSSMVLLPAPEFRLSCSIEFASPAIGRQDYLIGGLDTSLVDSLLPARTFVELESVPSLHEMGLGKGGGLGCAVVVSGNKVLNEEGLRFSNEFVRHKALDVVGDLRLAGAAIFGHCIAVRPGHRLASELLRSLFATPEAWSWQGDTDRESEALRMAGSLAESRPELL